MSNTDNNGFSGNDNEFYIKTPLLESIPLSKVGGIPVYIKCENCQPSGSFKLRGLGYVIKKNYEKGAKNIVIASGGNAGFATAYCAMRLGIKSTVVVPESSSSKMIRSLRDFKAEVIVHGQKWDEGNLKALAIAAEPGNTYLHPYDDPLVWEGHTSITREIREQLGGVKPRCLVVSVGGGGLLLGVIEGLKQIGWEDVPVIAVETVGADCFSASVKAGRPITLANLTSIAICLSTKSCCKRAVEIAVSKERPVIPIVVSDFAALDACYQFLDDHRFLVEPACGAALATVYDGTVQKLLQDGHLPDSGPVVVIACGGATANLQVLDQFKTILKNRRSTAATNGGV